MSENDSNNGRSDVRRLVPLARADELVVEELGDELLVYDLETDHAHSLGATAAAVWRRCDGKTTVEVLGAEARLDAATVQRAIDELHAINLLVSEPTVGDGTTRREIALRVTKVGAAAAALPLIWSIAAPEPAAAATPTPEFCEMGQGTTGCGTECDAFHCCCCCMGTGINPPQGNQLCFPTHLCEGVAGRNCSNEAPCP